MRRIQIDGDGDLRCWRCGSRNFALKRTKKGCLAFGLLSSKKTRCLGCGAFSQRGRPKTYKRKGAGPDATGP